MRRFKKTAALITALACALTPTVSFAKAVKGEVEKIIPYTPYGETTNSNIRLVLPEKYKDYVPEPYASKYEDGYSQWMIYKPVTLDGVFYTWALPTAFSNEDRAYDNKQNVVQEYVLFPGVPSYNQANTPEIEQINYPAKTTVNNYAYMNKDASKMRIIIEDTIRSFEKSFYPVGCLEGRDINGYGPMHKIPMVSIREFVDSVDYLSLMWDNGTIAVTNSKTGAVTNFCIYHRPGTIKAVLLDNISYASLTDLLIAQFGKEVFDNHKLFNYHHMCGPDLIYIKHILEDNSVSNTMKNFFHTLSIAGILNGYEYRDNIGIIRNGFFPDADVVSHYNFKTGLTVWDELEQVIVKEGCIYQNINPDLSNSYNKDIEALKSSLLEATANGSTDAQKVQLLINFLKNSMYITGSGKNPSPSVEEIQKIVDSGKFIGDATDWQKLFLMGCTFNNIPSVKLTTNHRTNFGEIVAAYHDGKWNYYDLENMKSVSKDIFVSNSKDIPQGKEMQYITVLSYTGLSNSFYLKYFTDEENEVLDELRRRCQAVGY